MSSRYAKDVYHQGLVLNEYMSVPSTRRFGASGRSRKSPQRPVREWQDNKRACSVQVDSGHVEPLCCNVGDSASNKTKQIATSVILLPRHMRPEHVDQRYSWTTARLCDC